MNFREIEKQFLNIFNTGVADDIDMEEITPKQFHQTEFEENSILIVDGVARRVKKRPPPEQTKPTPPAIENISVSVENKEQKAPEPKKKPAEIPIKSVPKKQKVENAPIQPPQTLQPPKTKVTPAPVNAPVNPVKKVNPNIVKIKTKVLPPKAAPKVAPPKPVESTPPYVPAPAINLTSASLDSFNLSQNSVSESSNLSSELPLGLTEEPPKPVVLESTPVLLPPPALQSVVTPSRMEDPAYIELTKNYRAISSEIEAIEKKIAESQPMLASKNLIVKNRAVAANKQLKEELQTKKQQQMEIKQKMSEFEN